MPTPYEEAKRTLVTVRDILRFGVSACGKKEVFCGHGADSYWDDMAALVLSTLRLPHNSTKEVLDAKLLDSERDELLHLIKRRVEERIPTPYLTHEAYFAGLPFYVDERVLIPRSPVAEVIESEFSPWIESQDVQRILDLCTGSGCIAIACAHAFPEAEITGSDISDDALAVAKINVEKYRFNAQVNLVKSNVFDNLSGEKFDVIISNPPYVDEEDMSDLPLEFKHEPKNALEAGHDGLDIVITILQQAGEHLTPHGILVVEVGNSAQALIDLFPDVFFTWLELSRGGDGVFLLTAQQLAQHHEVFLDVKRN